MCNCWTQSTLCNLCICTRDVSLSLFLAHAQRSSKSCKLYFSELSIILPTIQRQLNCLIFPFPLLFTQRACGVGGVRKKLLVKTIRPSAAFNCSRVDAVKIAKRLIGFLFALSAFADPPECPTWEMPGVNLGIVHSIFPLFKVLHTVRKFVQLLLNSIGQ